MGIELGARFLRLALSGGRVDLSEVGDSEKKVDAWGEKVVGACSVVNGESFKYIQGKSDNTIFFIKTDKNGKELRCKVNKVFDEGRVGETDWQSWDHIEVTRRDYDRCPWFGGALETLKKNGDGVDLKIIDKGSRRSGKGKVLYAT